MAKSTQDAGRLFNPHGRRHYRRRYSLGEVRAGLVVLALLGGVAGWVGWMGAHPDPALFDNADILDPGKPRVDRGVLPAGLAADGFVEGPVSHFDADNLYEKINGRAGYFTSKGFQRLSFVSLSSSEDPTQAVDVELYDMGTAENALGAYAGEKGAEVESERGAAGLWHRDRNALYMAHGKHYVRAIGADEGEAVARQLEHLRAVLEAGLEAEGGEALPWAHQLFSELSFSPGRVTYHRENAFSFGFARGVYAALGDDDETELFVAPATDAAAAEALAARFVEGFASYGEAVAEAPDWVKDRYLGSHSTARAQGALVVGVRGAPELSPAQALLSRLGEAVAALPAAARAEALAAAQAVAGEPAAGGDYAEQAPPEPPAQAPLEGEPAGAIDDDGEPGLAEEAVEPKGYPQAVAEEGYGE